MLSQVHQLPDRVRMLDLDDGSKLLIRPNRRRKAWLLTHSNRGWLGNHKTLDAAMAAAHAYARDAQACTAR